MRQVGVRYYVEVSATNDAGLVGTAKGQEVKILGPHEGLSTVGLTFVVAGSIIAVALLIFLIGYFYVRRRQAPLFLSIHFPLLHKTFIISDGFITTAASFWTGCLSLSLPLAIVASRGKSQVTESTVIVKLDRPLDSGRVEHDMHLFPAEWLDS